MGENCFAKCWYSGCNLIVLGIKNILDLLRCMGGNVFNRSGMGPGLVSMSPPNNSSWWEKFLFRGFFWDIFSFFFLFCLFWARPGGRAQFWVGPLI